MVSQKAFQAIHAECTMRTVPGLLSQLDSLQMNCLEAANSQNLTERSELKKWNTKKKKSQGFSPILWTETWLLRLGTASELKPKWNWETLQSFQQGINLSAVTVAIMTSSFFPLPFFLSKRNLYTNDWHVQWRKRKTTGFLKRRVYCKG